MSIIVSKVSQIISENELISKYHFSGNTSLYVFITENTWQTFDVMIDGPLLTFYKDSALATTQKNNKIIEDH